MNVIYTSLIIIVLVSSLYYQTSRIENFEKSTLICITCPKNSSSSRRINWGYADSNGYEFEVTDQTDKFKSIKELLELNLYKYVLWLDDRVFFNSFDKRIEDVFFKDETKDVIVFSNRVMLVKNTPLSMKMMNSGILSGPSVLFINELPSILSDHKAYSEEHTRAWIDSRKDLFPVFI